MRTNKVLTTAVMAVSVTAAVGAQSEKAMRQSSAGDAMNMAFTGCVESVNHGAWFLLTGVESRDGQSMHGGNTMKPHDDMAMKRDDMPMNTEAANTMPHEPAPMADDRMDAMSSKSFALAGSTGLSKHAGQKVSVTGSLSDGSRGTMRKDLSTLTIKTLKVIAKSCS